MLYSIVSEGPLNLYLKQQRVIEGYQIYKEGSKRELLSIRILENFNAPENKTTNRQKPLLFETPHVNRINSMCLLL